MNDFFEYLKSRKKEKIEIKKKISERYWKLSPIERIDYDNKNKRIEDFYEIRLSNTFTASMFKAMFYLMIFFCVFNYFFNNVITPETIIAQQRLVGYIFSLLLVFVSLDLFSIFYSYYSRRKAIEKINKRFKLDSRNI